MFVNEIANKSPVALYDNEMNVLVRGIITGYKSSPGYIIINHCLYYPVTQVAKVALLREDEFPYAHTPIRRQS